MWSGVLGVDEPTQQLCELRRAGLGWRPEGPHTEKSTSRARRGSWRGDRPVSPAHFPPPTWGLPTSGSCLLSALRPLGPDFCPSASRFTPTVLLTHSTPAARPQAVLALSLLLSFPRHCVTGPFSTCSSRLREQLSERPFLST